MCIYMYIYIYEHTCIYHMHIYNYIYIQICRGFYVHVIVDLAGVYGGRIPSMCDKLVCYHEPPLNTHKKLVGHQWYKPSQKGKSDLVRPT